MRVNNIILPDPYGHYDITFKSNKGINLPDDIEDIRETRRVNIPQQVPELPDYTFLYYTDQDNNKYYVDQEIQLTKNLELTPYFAKQYKLYNKNIQNWDIIINKEIINRNKYAIANRRDRISLLFPEQEGYKFKKVDIITAHGDMIQFNYKDGTFIMPNDDVKIKTFYTMV